MNIRHSAACYHHCHAPPAWVRFLWVLPLLLMQSLGLLLTQPLGWMATLAAVAPLMALQIRYHRRIEAWKSTLNSLNALLASSHMLAELGGPTLEAFVEARAEASRLHQRLGRPLLLRMMLGSEAYLNWFAAYNVGRYWKTVRLVARSHDFLRAAAALYRTQRVETSGRKKGNRQ